VINVRSTELPGVLLLVPVPFRDERGLFARTWDPLELAPRGIDPTVAQSSVSWNARAGTLRGLHLQEHPHEEAKLVRCTAGAVFDVAVDLRPSSPTFTRWVGAELTAENRHALYVPPGCAHGFITLTDGAEVYYQISAPYHPESARGFRWDDAAFGIRWPREPVVVSDTDRSWPDFAPARLPG
jgi:dTDP-4-dehydrorhamnose 3,5-epimerase